MKRVFFVLVVFFAMATASAQEKGLHLTLGGGLGWTNFAYDLDGGSYLGRLGGGGTIGAQYFFNRHWGISLAGEIYVFNTQSRYVTNHKEFMFGNQIDDQEHIYDFYVRLVNWKENQKTTFFEIPLMGVYQHKFGKKERHGLYFGLGVKAQIPIGTSSYERHDGDVRTWGYYPEWNVNLGYDVEMPNHGYGTNPSRDWHGDNDLRTSFAAVGEFGFLFGLSRRVDLTLGVVADYGFRNISNREDQLLAPMDGVTQQEGSYVSQNVFYNGILNSDLTPQINPWSIRGKVGLRVKIGKLKELAEEEEEEEEVAPSSKQRRVDTIYVYPVIKYIQPEEDHVNVTGLPAETTVQNPAATGAGSGTTKIPLKNLLVSYDPIPQDEEEELIESIYFDLDKSNLTAKSIEVLDRKVALMKKYPQAILTVVGHTCNIGSRAYNEKLSATRAEAARLYIIRKGISPSRVLPVPMGMENPTHSNATNPELNRRVDFFLAH